MDKPLCKMCGKRHYGGCNFFDPIFSRGAVSPPKITPKKILPELTTPKELRTAQLDVCPTCGHRLKPMTAAEKQRRYREKKRVGAT